MSNTVNEKIDKKNEAVKKVKSEIDSPSIQTRVTNIEILLGLREPEDVTPAE